MKTARQLTTADHREIDAAGSFRPDWFGDVGDVCAVRANYTVVESDDSKTAIGYATDGRVLVRTGEFAHDSRAYTLARMELGELATKLGWCLAHYDSEVVSAAERAGYTSGVAAETTTQMGEVTQYDEADGLGLVTLSSGLTRTFGLTSFRAGRPARHPAVGDQVDVVLSKQGSALIAVRLRK